MQTKLDALAHFLTVCWQTQLPAKAQQYSTVSMGLFFVLMQLNQIHAFKAMHRWANANYARLGWPTAPDRKTIRRPFLALPAVVQLLMPAIAQHCDQVDHAVFGYAWAYADKSVFRALGGLWLTKHRVLGLAAHPSIDPRHPGLKASSTVGGLGMGYI